MTNITLSLGCVLLSILSVLSSASQAPKIVRSVVQPSSAGDAGSPFVVGEARLKDKTSFLELAEPNKKLVEVKRDVKKFSVTLDSSSEAGLKAAHPRSALIAKRHYLHMFAMNFLLDSRLGQSMQQTKKPEEFSASLAVLYYYANRAVHYHLSGHFPQINQAIAEDFNKHVLNLIPAMSDEAMETMRKAQGRLAEILPFLRSRNPPAVAWINNYLSLAMSIGDLIRTHKAPHVVLSQEEDFRLGHIYRFIEFLSTGPNADEFMKRPIVASLTAFKKSIEQLNFFIAGNLDDITDGTSIAFLLISKTAREVYPDQLASLKLHVDPKAANAARKASEDIDKIVAFIGKENADSKSSVGSSSSVSSKRSKSKKKNKKRTPSSSQSRGNSKGNCNANNGNNNSGSGRRLPLVVIDDDVVFEVPDSCDDCDDSDDDTDIDADDVLQAMVHKAKAAKQSGLMSKLLGDRNVNLNSNHERSSRAVSGGTEKPMLHAPAPVLPKEKYSYDPRDRDYALVLIGEFVYQRFLTPFLEAYKWDPLEEVIWTDILYLLEVYDSDVVHVAITKAGMTPEFFIKAVHFYQARSRVSHPPSTNFDAEQIGHKVNQVKDIVWPEYRSKFINFFSSYAVGGEQVNPKTARGPTPLRLTRRPSGFQDADSVEAALASFDLYQYALNQALYPILRTLGLRKVDQIRLEHIEVLIEEDSNFPYHWEEINMLLYSFRRTKNNFGHPRLHIPMVVAYLEVFRDDPDWDIFFSKILARAQSEFVRRHHLVRD